MVIWRSGKTGTDFPKVNNEGDDWKQRWITSLLLKSSSERNALYLWKNQTDLEEEPWRNSNWRRRKGHRHRFVDGSKRSSSSLDQCIRHISQPSFPMFFYAPSLMSITISIESRVHKLESPVFDRISMSFDAS